MAVLADSMTARKGRDRFFLIGAFLMAAVIVAGFAVNLALGRSSFGLPLIFHVHAFIFFGWVALYLTQNVLIELGSVRVHRTLGWMAVLWVPAMVAMGTAITVYVVRMNIAPPFFDAREFLFGNPIAILCFAGLVATAIAMRRRTPWHRRLMFSAMAILTGPGFGRLLPMPFMIPWSWPIAAVAAPLLFIVAGIVADWIRLRSVHPAWLCAVAAILSTHLVSQALAFSALGETVTREVIAGMPGANRSFAPHFP
ncbi:MAG: hypothetical protein P0Y64_09350 [Candidatus Sphingomonas colombiensis]|nr:hypothetical protein [Sphingomonas sp.]WEK41644.1 MAG: hypothetical protein P0Y64_09350 [Sphingomonas sp.]